MRAEEDRAGDLAVRVLDLLAERGETLAVAESLTGGLVAGLLTGVPGASRVLRGSVTAYATGVKQELLGVESALLRARGAVDPEVARQMAGGARRLLRADWGIATTGVAGPAPQDGAPVGTVFVAVAGPSADASAGPGRDSSAGAGDAPGTPDTGPDGADGARDGGARSLALRLGGGRAAIRDASVSAVLGLLYDELTENAGTQDTEHREGDGCLQP